MCAVEADFSAYWAAWDERLRRERETRRARIVERQARAQKLVPLLAEHLVKKYGVRKVVLVGSLARGDFGEESDIDLVVQGLPGDALFRAGADVEKLAGNIPVDLIPIESATPRLKEALQRDGRVVHDAS